MSDSLEDLARRVWIAWGRLESAHHGAEWSAFCRAMADLGKRLDDTESPPTRALDYLLPARTQVEMRFACAMLSGDDPWPQNDHERQGIITEARRLARLLLDEGGKP